MTIRLRLTLLFVAMFALLMAGRGLVATASYRQTMENELGQEVNGSIRPIEEYLRLAANQQALTRPGRPFNWNDARMSDDISNNGLMIQVSRPGRGVLFRSGDLAPQRLPDGPLALREALTTGPQPGRVVVVADRFQMPGEGWLVLQVALPHTRIDVPMAGHLRVEVAVDLLMLVIALLAGYAVAGWALEPAKRLNLDMNRLSGARLDERLPAPARPRDEMERLAATFNRLLDRINASFEAQQRFVADASHELRSPLTAIRGYLEMIQKRGSQHPERAQAWLAIVGAETERLARLVDELLFLAKADVTHVTARSHVCFDLAELASRTVTPLAGLHARLAFEPSAPALVLGDPAHLARVVINLVNNALRATQEQGSVAVSLAQHANHVRLIVADSGHGLPAEAMGHLFERFYRADAARDRDHGGAGLGLAICQAIAIAHGGQIEVTSRPGAGATFVVTLPLAPAGDAASAGP